MDNREEKVASVLERISAAIANPVLPEDGDELPTPTREQVSGFSELVCDLANLAFEPDWKERNVLDIRIVDQKRFTMHEFYEPASGLRPDLYEADFNDPEVLRHFSDLTRTAQHMISQGSEMLKRISDVTSYRASQLTKANETASDFAGLRKLLEEKNLVEFSAEAERLKEKYDPPLFAGTGEARKTPYNRKTAYRKLPEELQGLIDEYGLALKAAGQTAEIDAAIVEIDALLDKAEPLVGIPHRENGYEGSFDEAIFFAKEALLTSKYRFGTRALQPVVVRFNRLSDEHRVRVRMAERGLKVVAA